jgi:cysteinyl-tRNA synthetase
VHNAWVKAGEEKMSKSLGNFVTIADALERSPPDAIRLWILTSHYRTPLTYTDEALDAAKKAAERLRTAARGAGDGTGEAVDVERYRKQFIDAMDADLNSPKALAALFDFAREINRARDEGRPAADAQAALLELADVLGLTLTEPEASIGAAPFIELLMTVREELRKAKQFDLADRVRDGLLEAGVALEDTPQGTVWRRRE